MKKKNSKRLKLLKGEKFMYFIIVLLLCIIPLFNVYTSSLVTKTNDKFNENKFKEEHQDVYNNYLKTKVSFDITTSKKKTRKQEMMLLARPDAILDQMGIRYKAISRDGSPVKVKFLIYDNPLEKE